MGNGIEADKIYEVMENLANGTEIEEVYLVGGCIRDHVLGAPIKDYDIAIKVGRKRGGGAISEGALRGWLTRRFAAGVICPTSAATYSGEFDGIPIQNYKFKYKGLDIDIIRVMEGTVLEWVNTFPCEASKVYYQFGTENFSISQAVRTKETNTFLYDDECPDEYWIRLKRKYPHYKHEYKGTKVSTGKAAVHKRGFLLRSCS